MCVLHSQRYLFFQFGATASVGLSGIQNFKNHEVSRRVSDNDGDIATLQTNLAATCAKVLINWEQGGAGVTKGVPAPK